MKNWSVDENILKKSPKKYQLWQLEQKISYGLGPNERLDRRELIASWPQIQGRLDPKRRDFLKFLLWS